MTTVSPVARERMLAALADFGGAPKTSITVAVLTHYCRPYVWQVLYRLAAAGEVVREGGGRGNAVLWTLPASVRLKRCSKCGTDKPISEFYSHPQGLDGVRRVCKVCTCNTANQRRWAAAGVT